MKASFSMSSLRDGVSSQEKDDSSGTPATLPRVKNSDAYRRHPSSKRSADKSEKKRDEFWEALQPSYDYLMDYGLIASCKEAKGELSLDEEDFSTNDAWTLAEFFTFCNDLFLWVEDLEAKVNKSQEMPANEMSLFGSKIVVMNKQSQNLLRSHPSNAYEINNKTTALNRLWDSLKHHVTPEEYHDEKSALKREIECQMRWLRKWIRGMEVQLGPIYRKSEWTTHDIETKLNHHREVQKKIESRAKIVNGVLKLCQRFEDLRAECRGRSESLEQQNGSCGAAANTPTNSSCKDGGSWIGRDFEHLQKRFHALWLHSLEWQTWLEILLLPGSQLWGSLREDASSSSSNDEPNIKIPRLSETNKANHHFNNRRKNTIEQTATNNNQENIDMVGMAGPVRPTDQHQDVGYSSESSAHLSNEEENGEFVRVYTYTSAEATSPRVLEVVMDGDHRPRKTPPRETAAADFNGTQTAGEQENEEMQTSVIQVASNCGTFYFRHEDSDLERPCHRQRTTGRKRLNFGSSEETGEEEKEERSESEEDLFEDMEENEDSGHFPDGIHKLVNEAEQLVKCPNHVTVVDSSCDASGEGSDSETFSRDHGGSVIHLKEEERKGSLASVVSDSGGAKQQNQQVKLRSKKRRSGERPSSVVEASTFSLKYASVFNSESALNRIRSWRKSDVIGGLEVGGRAKRSPRRSIGVCAIGSRKSSLEADGKCRSLGSLRHSSSSENGRWRSVGSSIFPKSKQVEEADNSSCSSDSSDFTGQTASADPDVTLIQVPDNVSSASEQAWDDYQEAPYLSEAYSETGVDDEAARKLLEFGDDYQQYIGVHSSDGASTPSFHHSRANWQLNNCGFDSESDIEDMNDLLNQHRKLLSANQLQLHKMASGECPKAHLDDILASVQIHIKCLRAVLEQLLIPLPLSGPGQQNRDRLKVEWEKLVMQATEQEERLAQLGHLENEARDLEQRMREAELQLELWSNKASNEEDVVEEAKTEVQKQLISLEQLNPTLLNLNFKIHDYVTRWQLDVVVLKNKVHTLYRSWDQLQENIEKKLNWLEELYIAWNDFKSERSCLKAVLQEDRNVLNQLAQTIKCSPELVNVARSSKHFISNMNEILAAKEKLLKTSNVSSNSRSGLANMTETAHRLQQILGFCGKLSDLAKEELEMATKGIEDEENECKQLLEHITKFWEEQKIDEQLNVERSCPENVSSAPVSRREEKVSNESFILKKSVKTKGESLLWRAIRAAVPIQLAVVILFCFACLFEPRCCDTLNNFNLSLTPQLRYLDGPPPV